MTHTYAVLDVPRTVYAAVRALLVAADYHHSIRRHVRARCRVSDPGEDDEVIDMHGIALRSLGGKSGTEITVSSLLSSRTKEGRVELQVNGEVTQMDLVKAHSVSLMLMQAIEAAGTDQMIYEFLTKRIGLSAEKASMALLDFRELRQGSGERVQSS